MGKLFEFNPQPGKSASIAPYLIIGLLALLFALGYMGKVLGWW